jgi:hypothetical protein
MPSVLLGFVSRNAVRHAEDPELFGLGTWPGQNATGAETILIGHWAGSRIIATVTAVRLASINSLLLSSESAQSRGRIVVDFAAPPTAQRIIGVGPPYLVDQGLWTILTCRREHR